MMMSRSLIGARAREAEREKKALVLVLGMDLCFCGVDGDKVGRRRSGAGWLRQQIERRKMKWHDGLREWG